MYISADITNEGHKVFIFNCTYDERMIAKEAGFYWNPTMKKWITPYPQLIEKLVADNNQIVDAYAINLYNTLIKEQLLKEEASRATESSLEIPAPEGLEYLPFQKAGISYISNNKNTLLSDQMGLGKSIQAIGLINLLKIESVLIICPASLKINWKNELKKWLTSPLDIEILDSKKPDQISDANIFIVNYDIIGKFNWLRAIHWGLLICDEAHLIKSNKARRSHYVYGEWDMNKNEYKIHPLQADRKLLLTGTPILNKPIEIYYLLKFLGFRMKWLNFVEKFCDGKQTEWGWNVKGSSNEKELQELLRRNFMIRRLKTDVLAELPPKIRQIIEIPVEKFPKQIRAEMNLLDNFLEIRKELEEIRDLEELDDLWEESPYKDNFEKRANELISMQQTYLVELARIRHLTALAKVPHVADHIKELLDECDKIVIFAHHRDVINSLIERFPDISVSLVGSDKIEARQEAVERFQNDSKIRLFFGSIMAAGVGITLTAASVVVFVELDWVPGNISQGEDRCVFKGQRIITSEGFKYIEDIIIGDKVLTHLGNFNTVTAIKSKLERKKLQVTIDALGYNEPLKVTEDHKIYVFQKSTESFEWVEASNIRPGRHLLVFNPGKLPTNGLTSIPVEKPFKDSFKNNWGKDQKIGRMRLLPDNIELSNELLFAFGFYVGNGHHRLTDHSGNYSSLVSVCDDATDDKITVRTVIQTIATAFGIDKINYYETKGNVYAGTVYSITLAYNFKKWFGENVYTKQFPEWVFQLNIDQCKHLLLGYYKADEYKRKNTQQGCTVSDKLITQLAILNGLCGDNVSVGYKDQAQCWNIEYTCEPNLKCRITTVDGKITYPVKSVKFSRPKKQGSERVYDLSVENDHSFVVGLYSVHNCHRIGQSDSVLVQHIVIDGSIDAKLAKMIVAKQEIIDKCLNNNESTISIPNISIDDLFDDDLITEEFPEDYDKPAKKEIEYNSEVKDFILSCLKFLSSSCDGAANVDGIGFSKYDTEFGKSLASCDFLTEKQARTGIRLLYKYRNQLDVNSKHKLLEILGES